MTNKLLNLVYLTKKDKSAPAITAASNSITILIAAKISFTKYDFTNISICGANLRNGIFQYCNFANADFSGVNLTNSNLIGCKFDNANLANIELSILPGNLNCN